MKKYFYFLIPLVLIVTGFILMRVFLSMKREPSKAEFNVKSLSVEAVKVNLTDIQSKISAFGKVVSSQPVELISEVSGEIKDGDISFKKAESFKKGDLLLKIDDRRIKLYINSTISEFLSALSVTLPQIKTEFPDEFSKWENYFNSIKFDHKLPQMPEVNNQKIKLFLSRNNVYKLYYNIRNLEIDLEKHYFYAPFDGSIVSTNTTSGTYAKVNASLGSIVSLDKLEVEIPVPAVDIKWIDKNNKITLYAPEMNSYWSGDILRIGQVIEQSSQTVPVIVSLNNNINLTAYDGLFMESNFPGTVIKSAVRVPMKAVYNEKFVYVVNDDMLEYREVSIARKETESVIVDDGLNDGDILVTEVLKGVASGTPAVPRFNESKVEID